MLVGTVHSGVAMGMVKVAREDGTLLIIPNAGADAATGALCAPNIFRTSFSNWQPVHPMGKVMADKGHKTRGIHHLEVRRRRGIARRFQGGFTAGGGKIVKELLVPFPNVEFQALLTEIAALKPDAVACFFAGGGAVKFVKDYEAAGLKDKIPLYGSGFLTDGVLEAQGDAAEGLLTTLHYADGSGQSEEQGFPRGLFRRPTNPDAGRLRGAGLRHRPAARAGHRRGEGRRRQQKEIIAAMEGRGHRQPARPMEDVEGAQPDPGHLPAPGRERREQGHRRRAQGARRSGERLQDAVTADAVASDG